MTTFALAMIVRDEETNIVRCLDSCKHLLSHWTIIDTGSKDRTKKLIRETLTDIPGLLLDAEWVNFRENRSELMAAARNTADYLILLDADMVLHTPEELPDLTEDVYLGKIGGSSLDYKLPLLVKGDKEWRYEGVRHSYLACEPAQYDQEILDGLWVEDHSVSKPGKLEEDVRALAEEHARNPLDARTVFYLAQSYHDLDRIPEAIHYYRLRSEMGGWGEEVYYARHRLGCLLCETVSYLEGAKWLLKAWEGRPSRAEALRALARVTDNVADKIPPSDDLLFVHRDAYAQPRISPDKISAVLVTRGDVDLEPVLEPIRKAGIEDIVVWDNSKREDEKIYGRYRALDECKNDVIFSIDDDVIFTAFDPLFQSYEPGMIVANMDPAWIQGAGYGDKVTLIGAGALWEKHLPLVAFAKYLAVHPLDDEFLLNCDFVFGSMTPSKRVNLGYEVREFADDEDRLYRQPGQTESKWRLIERGVALR